MKLTKLCRWVLITTTLSIFPLVTYSLSSVSNDKATEKYFNSIKTDPLQLTMFIAQMPKGGELHFHLSGATYAEDLIQDATEDHYCVDPQTYTLTVNNNCPLNQRLSSAVNNDDFYRDIIEHWSLMDFSPGEENQQSTEGHFFPVFIDFHGIVGAHIGKVLSEEVARGGHDHLNYMEIMLTPYDLNLVGPQGDLVAALGARLGWNSNFAKMRASLLANGLPQIIAQIPAKISAAENDMRSHLKCGTENADPGCHVVIRYQYLALRELPPEQVFAELLAAFEAAKLDSRIVAINLVQAEDGPIAERDYGLHMQMIRYLHQIYPQVHITLHAGELAPGKVPPEDLRSHIRDAINIAGAERIGHGTDIAYEDNAEQLLQEMADKHILVEINLTSNAKLLGIQAKEEPLMLYLANHVPVSLSTDDEGVLRTDINREFIRAVLSYNLDYETLKMLARNGLTYAFISGASVWQDPNKLTPVAACVKQEIGGLKQQLSPSCAKFLADSPKAQLQWELEQQFKQFEHMIVRNNPSSA